MANASAIKFLRPLTLDFQKEKLVEERELHKNYHWKKIMKLPTLQRYVVVIVAFRGLVQKRNPGYDNGLWRILVEHDLNYMLHKGNKQFLYEVAEEIKKVRDINTLPFSICWKVLMSLEKHEFFSCLSVLIEHLFKKHLAVENESQALKKFMNQIANQFDNTSKSSSEDLQREVYHLHNHFGFTENQKTESPWGTYFVDTQEEEEAWHRLDQKTKAVMQQYEDDLFYDRSPKPSQVQKNETIKAVQNSNLNKKHKKALIDSIRKKG
ncbi:hypothetical protein [Maribacter sp. 2308TA10-17]|uniref:hypothetical protein n=1 Tax=Maribacter sp. 2308TA10-17 TaxID=3386276 RepID=UPI0039BD1329